MIRPSDIVVYKWTHDKGYYYIGVHKCVPNGKCSPKKCKYIGSGVAFRKAYDADPGSWSRTILHRCDTYEDALALEKSLVGDRHKYGDASDPLCLNLTAGGRGATPETIAALWADPTSGYNTPEYRASISHHRKAYYDTPEGEAHKEYLRASISRLQTPEIREKHSAAISALRSDPDSVYNTAEYAEKQRTVQRQRTKIKMLDATGTAVDLEDRTLIASKLAEGWRFRSRCVYISNHQEKQCKYVYHSTASKLILSDGWEYGRARAYGGSTKASEDHATTKLTP